MSIVLREHLYEAKGLRSGAAKMDLSIRGDKARNSIKKMSGLSDWSQYAEIRANE